MASYATQNIVEARHSIEGSKLRLVAEMKEALEMMQKDNKEANMEIKKNIEALTLELRQLRTA